MEYKNASLRIYVPVVYRPFYYAVGGSLYIKKFSEITHIRTYLSLVVCGRRGGWVEEMFVASTTLGL